MGLDINRSCDQIDGQFLCPLCRLIVEQPLVAKCGHTFCKLCVNQLLNSRGICPSDRQHIKVEELSEPSEEYMELYSNFEIKCVFESIGCKVKRRMNGLIKHQNMCGFNPKFKCENGCDMNNNQIESRDCIDCQKYFIIKLQNEINFFKQKLLESNEIIEDFRKSLIVSEKQCESLRHEIDCKSIYRNIKPLKSLNSNSDGDIVTEGTTQLFYCGKRKNECRCGRCDGQCGPNNGCPCNSCLEYSNSLSQIHNRVGDVVKRGRTGGTGGFTTLFASNLYYCGKSKNECKCGTCDGRCGPSDGCPCDACIDLMINLTGESFLRNNEGYVVRKGKTGTGGDTGLPPSQLYYCGKVRNECRCGRCDGRCGPSNGCPCNTCVQLVNRKQS